MKTLQGSSQLFGLMLARNKLSKEILNVFQIYESYHSEKSGWRKKKYAYGPACYEHTGTTMSHFVATFRSFDNASFCKDS